MIGAEEQRSRGAGEMGDGCWEMGIGCWVLGVGVVGIYICIP